MNKILIVIVLRGAVLPLIALLHHEGDNCFVLEEHVTTRPTLSPQSPTQTPSHFPLLCTLLHVVARDGLKGRVMVAATAASVTTLDAAAGATGSPPPRGATTATGAVLVAGGAIAAAASPARTVGGGSRRGLSTPTPTPTPRLSGGGGGGHPRAPAGGMGGAPDPPLSQFLTRPRWRSTREWQTGRGGVVPVSSTRSPRRRRHQLRPVFKFSMVFSTSGHIM